MKHAKLILIIFTLFVLQGRSQDTFSIVAADSATREVGSAGASCVDLFSAGINDATFIGDLLPDTGAINSQAYYLAANQNNARARMRAGDSPQQIVSWLNANDIQSNPTIRQYGIVGFSGIDLSAEGFTGSNCNDYKNHKTGSINGIYYSIQGNILLGQQVIDSMESRFRNEEGNLACRLMAALQGAKMVGADTRCTTNGTSSLFAYVKVAQATDNYGSPSFVESVRTHNGDHLEPIDSLQNIFDALQVCDNSGIHETLSNYSLSFYPNPSHDIITIKLTKYNAETLLCIYDLRGQQLLAQYMSSGNNDINISHLTNGVYILKVLSNKQVMQEKLIIE